MNLRDIGIEWTSQELGLKLWLHPGTSFGRFVMVRDKLNQLLGYEKVGKNDVFRDCFLVADAFVLDYEVKGDVDIPLVSYFKQRSLFDIESNLNIFFTTLELDNVAFLYDAFNATRVQPEPSEQASDGTPKKTNETSVNDG